MAQKSWSFQLEDGTHTIDLEHGYWSGKRKIRLDGKLLQESSKVQHFLFDTGSETPFQINGHSGNVLVRTNGITFSYDVILDGRSLGTGQQVKPSTPRPGWSWLFIIACGVIPIVSLGGVIPVIIGIGGAFGCARISRNASFSITQKVIFCIGVTILCWVLFFLLIVGGMALR
jgi:hypothetical protein